MYFHAPFPSLERSVFIFLKGGEQMPSKAILESKQQIVSDLTEKLQQSVSGVLVDYRGITVADDTKLRKELREAGVDYAVIKNRLLSRATESAGLTELNVLLEGTNALAVSNEDPFAPARILADYAAQSKGKFVIKGGYLEGKFMDVAGIEAISKVSSKDALISQLLGMLNAPVSSLARALKAIGDKNGGGEAAPQTEEAAESTEA